MILARSQNPRHQLSFLSDDPLSIYEQRIALLKQNSGNRQRVLQLLEIAVLRYQNDIRYQNTPRYIRLWIMYIFYLPSHLVYPILFGLIDKHIGDKISIVYESIAYQQFRDKRQHGDIEATLLWGIRRKAQPLSRLDQDLYEYQTTGAIRFDINYYKLDNFFDSILIDQTLWKLRGTSVMVNKQHRYSLQTLRSQMDLLHLKLQHSTRTDILRDCQKAFDSYPRRDEMSFEELKARHYQHRLVSYSELSNKWQRFHENASMIRTHTFSERPTELTIASQAVTAKRSRPGNNTSKTNSFAAKRLRKRKMLEHNSLAARNCTSEIQQSCRRIVNGKKGLSNVQQSSDQNHTVQLIDKAMSTDNLEWIKKEGGSASSKRLYTEKPGEEGKLIEKLEKERSVSDNLRRASSVSLVNLMEMQQTNAITKASPELPLQSNESSAGPAMVNQPIVQLPHSIEFVYKQMEKYNIFHHKNYHDFQNEDNSKTTTIRLRQWFPSSTAASTLSFKDKQQLKLIELGRSEYHVIRQISEGGMAKVYLVQNTTSLQTYSLKVQQPSHVWEFYIGCQLQRRRRKEKNASTERGNRLNLTRIHGFYHYRNASFMLMDYIPSGTLLDAFNLYRPSQNCMPEPIALLFVLQLLDQLTYLHNLNIVHNDLKLDNVMVLLPKNIRNRDVESKGGLIELPKLYLIDYGQSIDVSALSHKPHQKLKNCDKYSVMVKANWPRACPKSDYPRFNEGYYPCHADYWQLAAMAHCLLFGTPMHTFKKKTRVPEKKSGLAHEYVLQQSIKRYWHKDLWCRFFQALLNPPKEEGRKQPLLLQQLAKDFKAAAIYVDSELLTAFYCMLMNRKPG